MSQVKPVRAIRAFRCFSCSDNRAVSHHQAFDMPQPVLAAGWGQVMLTLLMGKGSGGGVSSLVCPNSAPLLLLRQEEEEEMKVQVFRSQFRVFPVLWYVLSGGKSLILCLHLHLGLTRSLSKPGRQELEPPLGRGKPSLVQLPGPCFSREMESLLAFGAGAGKML